MILYKNDSLYVFIVQTMELYTNHAFGGLLSEWVRLYYVVTNPLLNFENVLIKVSLCLFDTLQ